MIVRTFLILLLSLQAVEGAKTIYFYPGFWGTNLFGGEGPVIYYNQDATRKLYEAAKSEGYDLRIADAHCGILKELSNEPLREYEYIVAFDRMIPDSVLARTPKENLILFLWEPPSTMPNNYMLDYHEKFGRVYTWLDGLVDNKKYFKIHYPVLYPTIAEVIDFDAKKLCTMVSSYGSPYYAANELYSERRRLAEYFETHHQNDFDLYGSGGWSALNLQVYKGMVPGGPDEKIDVLKNYKFVFAYENCKDTPGYVSEKIFACFQAGTVPIYFGAPNITSYVPKNCFIAKEDFVSYDDLYTFLSTMGEEEYQEYLDNIQKFLKSDQARAFSIDAFIATMIDLFKTPSTSLIPQKHKKQFGSSSTKVEIQQFLVKSETSDALRKLLFKDASTWIKPINAKIIPLKPSVEESFYAINPSICTTENGYEINCRLVNYDHNNGMDYWPRSKNLFINRNTLLTLDKTFNILSEHEIVDQALYNRYPMRGVTGFEDCRLFKFKGENWFTCTITDGNPLNVCQIGLGKLSNAICTAATPLLGPNILRKEKNWLPFVHEGAIHAIAYYDPLTIFKLDPATGKCTTAFESDPPFNTVPFSGSAGPIPFEEGYLVLIHECNITDKREYFHRFLLLDKTFQITKVSPLFIFQSLGIEFACGMVLDHEKKHLVVSFGKEDREAYLALIDTDYINQLLSIQ